MKLHEVLGSRWAEYERRKKRLKSLGLSPAEYEQLVKDAARELKL